ncbi:outer membrane protein assembly factor BamA [Bartonella tamiae]|uniref:Outer membrane protein assembly factor BamA n=1 Tax=Bartonella tamiae Th239 TaxID=1094558 RepID=J0ZJY4_9HYPH|nr:outer membrane protein assembly factor BamA [Bartonella tamiae]EJF88633.1 outer membrane protein assembly complex, YaeT protein [Bartonella tamiae Th239]EJF95117.1 outer membrane protein assembly complex, YaeT protein [Bartonella tamiae Th307]
MKANSKFLSAASALALTVAMSVPAAVAVSVATVSIAKAAVVRSIDVRGIQRVDAQTIRDNIDIQVGKNFSSRDIDESVKRLFAMGLFSDVKINQSGNRLIVSVKEYEVVNQILFQGNKKVKDPDLERVISLKPREAFDPVKLASDEQTIREAYRYVGRNDTAVTAQTIDLGQGRVNVVFKIDEGQKTKIDDITFEGNEAFGDRRLRDIIATKRSGILSWLTRGDVYSEDRLAADEEALRRFYYNRGYADFQVVSANAVFDEASNSYKINFVVDEGQRYTLGDVEVDSTVEGIDTQSMQNALKTHSGDVYSAKRIEDTVLALNDRVADSGYAFARVEPRGDRDFNNHTISIVYNIDQGPRAYVERIEIRGNDKTRDYVIRREIDLNEGDAYNQTMVQRAKRRLEALGFFQTVNVSTAPGLEPDQVVLIVDVVEKSTGEFSIGGGYTTGGESPGASVEASITERNFLGRGQYFRIGVGAGEDEARNYNLSFTEPYFLGYRLSAGFDIFRRTYRMNGDYDVKQTGGSVRFGVPITDQLTGSISYNYIQEEYDLDHSGRYRRLAEANNTKYEEELANRYSGAIIEAADKSPWTRSSISYGLTYNSIDDMRNPHEGIFIRGIQEYAGIGGDANFLKTSGKAMLYKTVSEQYDIVGLVSIGGGYIHEIGNDGVRIFDMFKNNSDMIRGFKYNGIGPQQKSSNGDRYFLGGTTYMNATAELQFPMPVVPESLGMRGAVFADTATLYGNTYDPIYSFENPVTGTGSSWRASAGLSLMWASPFGPLRFDYAWPIAKEEGDRVQNFNFGVSTKF